MRLSSRASWITACTLVFIGVFRFGTDTLHEMNPDYWRALEGTPLRYLVRAPSDGTIWGWLNAQCFKLLSVPAGISLIFLRNRIGSGSPEAKAEEFRDWAVRGVWVVMFLLGFTALELEKQFQIAGSATRLVEGENVWLNHGLHLVSALFAWKLSGMFSFGENSEDIEATARD